MKANQITDRRRLIPRWNFCTSSKISTIFDSDFNNVAKKVGDEITHNERITHWKFRKKRRKYFNYQHHI